MSGHMEPARAQWIAFETVVSMSRFSRSPSSVSNAPGSPFFGPVFVMRTRSELTP